MITTILSWLLHHANRHTKLPQFYAVKERILKAYGTQVGYDIQHIPGKKCRVCGGSGVYVGYHTHSGEQWEDTCNSCWWGWFKQPQWICLARIRFGKFTFHRPLKREHAVRNPFTADDLGWVPNDGPVIEGYIDHEDSKYGRLALCILYLLYDRRAFRNMVVSTVRALGRGYYSSWRSPYRFVSNVVHIVRYGRDSLAFDHLMRWWNTRAKPPEWIRVDDAPYDHHRIHYYSDYDDIPF